MSTANTPQPQPLPAPDPALTKPVERGGTPPPETREG
jgi:hypothetical protein